MKETSIPINKTNDVNVISIFKAHLLICIWVFFWLCWYVTSWKNCRRGSAVLCHTDRKFH